MSEYCRPAQPAWRAIRANQSPDIAAPFPRHRVRMCPFDRHLASYSGDWLTPIEPLRRLTTLRTLHIPSGSLEEKLAFGLLRYASAAHVSFLKAKILLLNLPLNKNSC